MNELWRPVPGYVGSYEVSSLGRVRSLDRLVISRIHKGVTLHIRRAGRVLSPAEKGGGYMFVGLSMDGKTRAGVLHILVLEAFAGPRPPGMLALHNDDDKRNNSLSNLRWGTPSENCQDAIRNGKNSKRNKETCARGHLLIAPNLRSDMAKRGRRGCLACRRAFKLRTLDRSRIQELSDLAYGRIMRECGESA